MRPATPKFYNFAQQAGPSSPPRSPTSAQHSDLPSSKWSLSANDAAIKPKGNGSNFFYIENNLITPDSDSGPSRGSSIASSLTNSPARSRSASPAPAPLYSPPPPRTRPRVVTEGNFTIEEFIENDYKGFESGDDDVVRPYQYEDAESDKAKSVASIKDEKECDIDDPILSKFEELNFEDDEEDTEWMAWKYARRRARFKRFSGGSSKRSFDQSIGSDTCEEDLQPLDIETNEPGSNARRLRRKLRDRTSLPFDDPFGTSNEVGKEPGSGSELDYEDLFPTRAAKEKSPWQKEVPYQTISSANWVSTVQNESILSDSDSDRSSRSPVGIKKPKPFAAESYQDRLGNSHGHSQSSSMTESSVPEDATDWDEDSDVELWIGARNADGYFSAELDDQSALSNTLEPMKKQIVDRLMEEFWIIFNKKFSAGARQHPGAPTTAGNATTISVSYAPGRALSGGSSGARQSRRNREDEDPEEGPTKGSGGNGKQPESMPNANEAAPGFACPFRKRNPRKYCMKNWRSCALSPQKTVARVKGHLYRCHMIHQCQRCKCLFNSEEELDSHIETSSNCDAITAPPVDGVTRKIKSLLQCKRKAFPGQTEAERWKQVYQILFPLDEEVPDPYFEPIRENEDSEPLSPDFASLTNYEEFLRRMLPRFVRSALETEVNNEIQPIEDRLRGQILDVIVQAQNRAFQEYRGMMEESLSADPSVDSGYVSNQAGAGPSRDKGKGPANIGPPEASLLSSVGPSNTHEAAKPSSSHFFGSGQVHTSIFENTTEVQHSFPSMRPPENIHFGENMPDDFVASEGLLLSDRLQPQDQSEPDMMDLNSIDWSRFLEVDLNLK